MRYWLLDKVFLLLCCVILGAISWLFFQYLKSYTFYCVMLLLITCFTITFYVKHKD